MPKAYDHYIHIINIIAIILIILAVEIILIPVVITLFGFYCCKCLTTPMCRIYIFSASACNNYKARREKHLVGSLFN